MPLDPHLLGAIAKILAPAQILTAQEDILPYGFDGTAAIKQSPGAVVFPKTTQEVAACMRLAAERGVPVVTRGSGTGLSGGSVPLPNCLVMCLVDMNAILDVDTRNLTLRAQSGVITQRIDEAAAPHGLFYPPDPGSLRISTIGGNVAENSGGLRGLKYGVTRDYVMGLEAVLADGTIARFGNACVKDVAGYSLKDLFIGSEGTLGIITEVLLKLLPRPEARKTLLAVYDRMEDAAETVSAIIASKIIPCTLEFLDRVTIAYLCSPANPQGAVASRAYWHDLLALAEKHDFIIFADECYSEIWRSAPPPGALEVAAEMGANPERVFTFHSLSKRSNLPGLRSGFVAGGTQGIAQMRKLRSFAGAPLPLPIQRVSEAAWADEAHVIENRALYQDKFRAADAIFAGLQGFECPEGGFFLWLPVEDGEAAALKLWRETGVRVLPGAYLSRDAGGQNPGKTYLRVALVAPKEEMQRGLIQLRDCLYG